MRLVSGLAAAVILPALASPAQAQFGAPFGAPGYFTAPEITGGAIGAGAANNAAQTRPCTGTATGRDGPRGVCGPQVVTEPPRRR